jgi:hypothetical protein
MKRSLACACMLFVSSLYSHQLFAQSIPVGQITRQITKPESQEVDTFQNKLDEALQSSNAVSGEAASKIVDSVGKADNLSSAVSTAKKNLPSSPIAKTQAQTAIAIATASAAPQPCTKNSDGSYTFKPWFPVAGCSNDAINSFFKVSGGLSIANTVSYLYNPDQSTNQISSDLFTATFSQGFQAILSGTATQGSSQPSSTSPSTSSTESVSTAVSKLEQGGDFNVRFPYPIFYHVSSNSGVYMLSSPNVGFMVNGSSGQNTITQSTEYNINVPLEFFAETTSIQPQGSSNAQSGNVVMYLDVRPAAEIVSSDFASAIGLKSNRYFFLGQASAGLSFNKSMRVGFQYYFGPSQVYQVPSTTGTTTKTGKVGGVHLVVSFSPNKSKS